MKRCRLLDEQPNRFFRNRQGCQYVKPCVKLVFLSFLCCVSPLTLASVTVTPEQYGQWGSSHRISNGIVDVVVAPKIGRIMFYGFKGKKNILWENSKVAKEDLLRPGYDNIGGDKVWFAPQSLWNWPPDPSLDGSEFKSELIKNGVRITSSVGQYVPIVITRDITLSDIGTEVKIVNKMRNNGPVQTISLWQVTQVNDPSVVELPTDFNSAGGKGYTQLLGDKLDPVYHDFNSKMLRIARHPKKSFKFGAKTLSGILRAKVDGTWFESVSKAVRNVKYPDSDSAQEIYTNPDSSKYVELEHLGPLMPIDTGEVVIQTVVWRLR
jgi:hypothetical protein